MKSSKTGAEFKLKHYPTLSVRLGTVAEVLEEAIDGDPLIG